MKSELLLDFLVGHPPVEESPVGHTLVLFGAHNGATEEVDFKALRVLCCVDCESAEDEKREVDALAAFLEPGDYFVAGVMLSTGDVIMHIVRVDEPSPNMRSAYARVHAKAAEFLGFGDAT